MPRNTRPSGTTNIPSDTEPKVFKRRLAPEEKRDFDFEDIEDGKRFSAEGATLRSILTPGHTPVSIRALQYPGYNLV